MNHTADLLRRYTVQQNVDTVRRVVQVQVDRKQRERSGLAPEPLLRGDSFDDSEPVDPVVQIVLQNQYEDFGFRIYRVNYDDEEKWARWYENFAEFLETSLEDYHTLMLEDQAFPLGVATGAAVAVDISVMDALLNPTAGVPP